MEKLTMQQLFNMVISDCKQKGNRSVRAIEAHVENHLAPYFANKLAEDQRNQDIRDYIDYRKGQGAKPATINREQATIRRGFNLALEDERITRKPKIRNLPENNGRKGIISHEQYEKIKNYIAPRYRPLVVFGYHKPWRIGEILSILREDVEVIKDSVFTIRLREDSSKNKEPRMVVVVEGELFDVVAQALERSRLVGSQWLFCHSNGAKIGRSTFYPHWRAAFAAAGVPATYVFHTFRHTSNTNHFNATKDTKFVMENAGHKSESMSRHYHHIDLNSHITKTKEVEAYLRSQSQDVTESQDLDDVDGVIKNNRDIQSSIEKTRGIWGKLRKLTSKLITGGN